MENTTLTRKPVRVAEISEAIRKNGLPQIFSNFYEYESHFCDSYHKNQTIIGACAAGQAALNLGVDAISLIETELTTTQIQLEWIVAENDFKQKPFSEIADRLIDWFVDMGYDPDETTFEILELIPSVSCVNKNYKEV